MSDIFLSAMLKRLKSIGIINAPLKWQASLYFLKAIFSCI